MNTCETIEIETVDATKELPVHLPLGLLGFEAIKQYSLISDPSDAPFLWLQVMRDPTLAFLVLSPFEVMPDYQMELTAQDTAFLQLKSPGEALVYCIVTLPPNRRATINLKGPIVLNRSTMAGKQVVLANACSYSLQHPLPTID